MPNLNLKRQLNTQQLAIVQSEFEKKKKSLLIAYLLWFFLGGLGFHRFYTERKGSAIFMLCMWLVGWVTTFILIGYFIIFVLYTWVLIDGFLLYGKVNKINDQIERDIIQRVIHTSQCKHITI